MDRNMSFSWICSPKSPPNSPNTELSTEDELKGVYINYGCNKVSFMQSILHYVFFTRSGLNIKKYTFIYVQRNYPIMSRVICS